jgi:hypothetical protein
MSDSSEPNNPNPNSRLQPLKSEFRPGEAETLERKIISDPVLQKSRADEAIKNLYDSGTTGPYGKIQPLDSILAKLARASNPRNVRNEMNDEEVKRLKAHLKSIYGDSSDQLVLAWETTEPLRQERTNDLLARNPYRSKPEEPKK